MFRKRFQGQTFIEYTLMIGVLITVLVAMTPMMRRGIQAMVKVSADMVGDQANADQRGGRYGQLINSTSFVQSTVDDAKTERSGAITRDYGSDAIKDQVRTQSRSYLNQGFTEQNN